MMTDQREKPSQPSLVKQKLVIDVDTGIDDAHAIMLALSRSEVDVLAITCANGNVGIEDVVDNTLRVLQVCERMEVPVYKGASRSLLGKVSGFDNFSGSAWKTPVDRSHLQTEHAANALVRLVNQFPGEITLVALAPLTNVALAVNLDPDFPKKLKDVFIMGGNTEARGREFMEEWTQKGTPKSDFLRDSLEFDVATAKNSGSRKGYRTCDGFAMATVLDGGVAMTEEEAYATVELAGQLTRGQMVVDWARVLGRETNVRLVMGLDMARTQSLLQSIVVSS
ncbi:hypothetical protein ACOMHN_011991 [Nucella lapillus]